MSDRRAAAEATLTRLGLDADAVRTGRTDAAALAPLLAGPDGVALATALGELAEPAVTALLVALEPATADRAVRKELRRSLYRLRQRGVPAPEPAPPAAPAARPPELEIDGFVTAVDGRGDRLLWLARGLSAGGVLLVAAQANEPAGLREVHTAEITRKALRAARQRIEHEAGMRMIAAGWQIVDALLVEAHERAGGTDREHDYLRIRPRVTGDAPAAPAEPTSARVAPVSSEEADALVAGSEVLLNEPELRTWWPPAEALASIVEEIETARESPLVLSRAAQEDRVREAIGHAADRLVPPAVFARRLAGTAYVLAETGRGPAARQALAVARVLADRPRAAAQLPFVAAYVERALGALLSEQTARSAEERRGSLVVTPGEYLRDRSSGHPPRTRG